MTKYSHVQLSPPTVCSAIEDAALALPDLVFGEQAWSVEDILEEATGQCATRAHQEPIMPNLINLISKQNPTHQDSL